MSQQELFSLYYAMAVPMAIVAALVYPPYRPERPFSYYEEFDRDNHSTGYHMFLFFLIVCTLFPFGQWVAVVGVGVVKGAIELRKKVVSFLYGIEEK